MHQTRMGTSSNMQQLYSLTWSEFSTSMVASMQSLRGHADFVDVTLAAGGRSFPAHKIVLSAASPFLLDILKSTPCKHPVVFMAGVAAADLEALLEFVYRGEVSIDPAQLPSLLQAATCLNIQGLVPNIPHAAKSAEDKGVPLVKTDASREMISSFLPVRRRKRIKRRESPGTGGKWSRSDGDENSADQAAAAAAGDGAAGEQSATTKSDGTGENLTAEELAALAAAKNSVSDQPAICPLCGATLRQSRNLRRHLELIHFTVGKPKTEGQSPRRKRSQEPSLSGTPPPTPVSTSTGPVSPPSTPHSAMTTPPPVTTSQSNLPPFPNLTSLTNLIPMPMSQMAAHMESSMGGQPQSQQPQLIYHHQRHDEMAIDQSNPMTSMLPPLPSPHDAVFRQHHTEMLRGAGLYADTRPSSSSSSPTGTAQASSRSTDNVRQGVA